MHASGQPRFLPPRRIPIAAGLFCAAIISGDVVLAQSTPRSPKHDCDPGLKRACEELVQDNILWKIDEPDSSAARHWQQKNLDNLCACTADPYQTVNCFQIEVNNHRKTWQEAIATCHAQP